MRYILLFILSFPVYADYFQAPDQSLHYLSTQDIENGGEKLLPSGSVPITDNQANTIISAQQAAAAALAAKQLNKAGFVQALTTAFGGIVAANTYARTYPLFMPAVESLDWVNVQALIIDASNTGAITPTQYAAIKAAAAANNVPITLP